MGRASTRPRRRRSPRRPMSGGPAGPRPRSLGVLSHVELLVGLRRVDAVLPLEHLVTNVRGALLAVLDRLVLRIEEVAVVLVELLVAGLDLVPDLPHPQHALDLELDLAAGESLGVDLLLDRGLGVGPEVGFPDGVVELEE